MPRALALHRAPLAVESVVAVEERVVSFAVESDGFHRLVEARMDVL